MNILSQIHNIHKNCMGTISFTAKLGLMKKEADFTVYPINETEKYVFIQSDKYCGYFRPTDHQILLARCKLRAMMPHVKQEWITLLEQDSLTLINAIKSTAGEHVGDNFMRIFCDNSKADQIGLTTQKDQKCQL